MTTESFVEVSPDSGLRLSNLKEVWAYRGLLFFLVWRDVKVRYAQTVMGAAWAVIQPILTMIVFTVIFGMFAKMPSDGVPYSVFSLAALVPWTFFSVSLAASSNSLVGSTNLITKVYFPRIVIPLAPVIAALVDFAIGFVILLGVMLWYRIIPGIESLVVMPVLLLSMILTSAGAGCWLAALNIQYRDIKYAVPFLVQIWMYASPIVYPLSLVPPRFRMLYALNPLAGVIEGFRSCLLHTHGTNWATIFISMAAGLLVFLSGARYFRRTEDFFVDVA